MPSEASLGNFPSSWAQGLQPGAALFQLDQWRRALDEAHPRRTDGLDVRPMLTPVLEQLAQGPSAADDLGRMLLESAAQALWTEALRRAPPQALEFSLQELRLPDGRDPGACAVWCPASHLAAAPRRFVRLLGMTTRSWPRRAGEDPMIPSHIVRREDEIRLNNRSRTGGRSPSSRRMRTALLYSRAAAVTPKAEWRRQAHLRRTACAPQR